MATEIAGVKVINNPPQSKLADLGVTSWPNLLERSVWDQHLQDGQQHIPLRISKQDHAPVLKSTLLQHDTTANEGHAEHGNSIVNSGDALNPLKTMAMEVSSDKANLILEIQKDPKYHIKHAD
uniref:Uncharacterized protein n=1 Tax=Solanum tuberosum TaxID=4113 RepID=M0ZU37_SOLTU